MLFETTACAVCGSHNQRQWAQAPTFTAVECATCGLIWIDPPVTSEQVKQPDRLYELDMRFLQQFVRDRNSLVVTTLTDLQQAVQAKHSYAVVVLHDVLGHIAAPKEALRQAANLLQPDGYLLLTSMPNGASFSADLYREKWQLLSPRHTRNYFNPAVVALLGQQVGLTTVATNFPYLEIPTANPSADHAQLLRDFTLINQGRRSEVTASPAFWGNIFSTVLKKSTPNQLSSTMTHPYMTKFQNSHHPYVIAEIGLNHNGSVETAKKLIDVAVVAQADAVKFQKRTVDTLAIGTVLDAQDERFPEFGSTYRQIREHLEFTFDEYTELKNYSEERGIDFLCTAFDIQAADFLVRLGVESFKLASHSLTNIPLLRHIAQLGKPAIISTGMAELEDVDKAVEIFQQAGTPFVLMHCVSAYPTPPDQCNLAMIEVYKERYNVPVGYSGHELGYVPTLASIAMGAIAIERHITLDKTMPGFDHKISLEPQELIEMVRDIRITNQTRGTGQKKVSDVENITLQKYHVSMVSAQLIPRGTVITEAMITYKNPGTGIPPKEAQLILGKMTTQEIPADTLLAVTMVQ